MKKHTVIALASALTIAAGSIFAADGFAWTERSGEKDTGISASDTSGDSISYDDAIAELYARSTSISDQEILEIARKMKPDCTAIEEELGADAADQIMNAINIYEQNKADHLLGDESAQENEDVMREWEKQAAYTKTGMDASQTLTALIPGYTVTSCSEENGQILVDVDEWMTEGYVAGADTDTENVSAYRYYFTAVLEKDKDGGYEVASVIKKKKKKTSSLKTYGVAGYNYNPDKAIAYADKWATSRNPEYRQYPGVDCCNFVSQCLYAGGMPKNSSWYPGSYDWINCTGAISNFKKYGKFMSASDGNVLKGNPVYYDWNSNGVYDHTAICVGRNSAGTPIIDAHTGDHYHVTWRLGRNGKRATIQLRGSGSSTDSQNAAKSTVGKWKKKNGKWYYYDANGKLHKGWLKYKKQTYYLKKNGQMATGWQKVGKSWYYFAKSGEMKTGWIKLGTRKYYLGSNGKMQTGWVKSNGKNYYMCSAT